MTKGLYVRVTSFHTLVKHEVMEGHNTVPEINLSRILLQILFGFIENIF